MWNWKKRIKTILLTGVVSQALVLSSWAPLTVGATANQETVNPAADPSVVQTNSIPDWPQAPDIMEETGVLMDTGSKTILYNKSMDEKRYPASITKIMTALLALEHSKLDDKVTFTATGVKEAYPGSSNIGMQVGEVLTMEQCLYAMMLKSANEVTTQVAEHIGGSVEEFVNMMNQKAADLGCTNTHFNNANGLPDENHYTTAHDMALIGQAAIQNETFQKIISTEVYTLEPTNKNQKARSFDNHHAMIHEGDWYYDGCMGGKTGFTDASQSTLVTFAKRDGMLLVCVLMKGDGTQIVKDTKTILDYGYDNFKALDLSEGGNLISGGSGVIPKDKQISDLQRKEVPQQDGVTENYFYGDYQVGSATITKESYDERKAKEEQEKLEKQKQQEKEQKQAQLQKTKEQQESKNKKAMRIIIYVLSGCILLTLLLLIIKVISNRNR